MRILHSKPSLSIHLREKKLLGQTSTHSVTKGGIPMTQTQVAYWNYKENQKHNRISEAEEQRSHLADEAERAMHNRATEQETHRHYLATETETTRANQANEYIRTQQLQETVRSNLANESLDQQRIQETARSNRASEDINRARNSETQRHNKETEATEAARTSETVRHNKRVEQYTSRDNIWSNVISALKSLPLEKVMSHLLAKSQETPGLTQEQKDRLAAETEYWKARTEAERSRSSRSPWTPSSIFEEYKTILRKAVPPTVGETIIDYLGGN